MLRQFDLFFVSPTSLSLFPFVGQANSWSVLDANNTRMTRIAATDNNGAASKNQSENLRHDLPKLPTFQVGNLSLELSPLCLLSAFRAANTTSLFSFWIAKEAITVMSFRALF